MERRGKPPAPPRRRHGTDQPSFSSSLLDAIYRSIDESDLATGAHDRPPPPAAARPKDRWRSGSSPGCRSAAAGSKPEAPTRASYGGWVKSNSSSSECSSYGGFSSSDAESLPRWTGLRPIRTGARPGPAIQPPAVAGYGNTHQEKKSSSIRSRIKDFRAAKRPASPGARLASFLNSIFAAAAGNSRNAKPAAATAGTATEDPSSAHSTASSYSRSCLSKTPSTRGRSTPAVAGETVAKKSVQFYPVSVIMDGDCRPCGQKRLYDGDRPAAAAMEGKKRVEELLRELNDEEEEEEEEEESGSDSSSDLFELENLGAIGDGGSGGYRDELPVYETTSLGANRAIACRRFL